MIAFPKLVVRHGPNKDQEYTLTMNTSIVGREPINDVVFADPEISRRHARIVAQAGSYYIEDLGSTNGTFVNGRRIHAVTRLGDNDIVDLGESIRVTFVYPSGNQPEIAPAQPAPAMTKPLAAPNVLNEEGEVSASPPTMTADYMEEPVPQMASISDLEPELYENHQNTRRQMYFLIGGISIVAVLCTCTAVFIALTYGTQLVGTG